MDALAEGHSGDLGGRLGAGIWERKMPKLTINHPLGLGKIQFDLLLQARKIPRPLVFLSFCPCVFGGETKRCC